MLLPRRSTVQAASAGLEHIDLAPTELVWHPAARIHLPFLPRRVESIKFSGASDQCVCDSNNRECSRLSHAANCGLNAHSARDSRNLVLLVNPHKPFRYKKPGTTYLFLKTHAAIPSRQAPERPFFLTSTFHFLNS